jgi:ADP-heptose:LPS heptosyltransferase
VAKVTLNKDGVCCTRLNRPSLPPLHVVPTTKHGKQLIRLHKIMAGDAPSFCIVRGEGIGDVLMTTPVASFLLSQYPGATITYATNTSYLNGALVKVLQHNPQVSNIVDWHAYDESQYDLVINLHCPCVAYEKPKVAPLNRIDLFARHAGIAQLTNTTPVYIVTQEELETAAEHLRSNIFMKRDDKLVFVNTASSASDRTLDLDKIRDAIVRIRQARPNTKFVTMSHSSDQGERPLWDGYIDWEVRDWNIDQLAPLLALSDLLICPDSAMLHLAGALETPTLALFGLLSPAKPCSVSRVGTSLALAAISLVGR